MLAKVGISCQSEPAQAIAPPPAGNNRLRSIQSDSDISRVNIASFLIAVQMGPRSTPQLGSEGSAGQTECRLMRTPAAALEFRQKLEESEKILAAYECFEGIEELPLPAMIEAVEMISEKPLSWRTSKNEQEVRVAFAEALKNLSRRIALAPPPSVENGRIYWKNIQGIPPAHSVTVMTASLLATYDGNCSHIFELKAGSHDAGAIVAVPCLKYGEAATHINPGKCLDISASGNVLVLHRARQDEIRILSRGNEKSFTSRNVKTLVSQSIFYNAQGECSISPDGKSLSFLFRLGLHSGRLVHGYSNTPNNAGSFSFEIVSLTNYGATSNYDNLQKDYIFHMTQSVGSTWSLISAFNVETGYKLFSLPLPLGSGHARMSNADIGIWATAMLPDNTIAAVSREHIKVVDCNTKLRAACKIYRAFHGKIKTSPDGRSLAVIQARKDDSELAFYQMPSDFNLESGPGNKLENTIEDCAELVHLWSVPLNGAPGDYDVIFIDYGSKMALAKRADPGARMIIELIERGATA